MMSSEQRWSVNTSFSFTFIITSSHLTSSSPDLTCTPPHLHTLTHTACDVIVDCSEVTGRRSPHSPVQWLWFSEPKGGGATATGGANGSAAGSPSGSVPPIGGLFTGGVPKLRPVTGEDTTGVFNLLISVEK